MVSATDLVGIRTREVDGWELREAGPADAGAAALLLPGGLCPAAIYDEVLAHAVLREPDVRLVAATPPAFAGRAAPADLSVESFARLASELAAGLECRIVVGHSYGANIALEMAASGGFAGPLVLLSPAFSREDEFKELGLLDRFGRVPGVGPLAWKMVPRAVAHSLQQHLPPGSRAELVAELHRNEPQVCRRLVRRYFEYLDRNGPLVDRLCETGLPAWIVFGDHKEAGLTSEERRGLEACAAVTLEIWDGATHMLVAEEPRRIAELVLAVAGEQ